jgi:6-phosphogluconate dehydrogenase
LALLTDSGVELTVHDIWETNLRKTEKVTGLPARVHICKDYDSLCASLGSPKVFIFSFPNGRPGDASDESQKVTQARQQILGHYGVV